MAHFWYQFVKFLECTLPETNIDPENRPSQKEIHLPTIHFSGAVLVSGSVHIQLIQVPHHLHRPPHPPETSCTGGAGGVGGITGAATGALCTVTVGNDLPWRRVVDLVDLVMRGYPYHQEFQVSKMEGLLNLMFGYFGGGFSMGFPYISRIHTAYKGEYLIATWSITVDGWNPAFTSWGW